MSYDLVTVARYDSSIVAHIMKAHLDEHGLVCFVFEDQLSNMYGMFSDRLGGHHLKVRQRDLEEATRFLQELKDSAQESDG